MTTNDETERNRSAVTAAFEAWRDNNAPITAIFAPEMTWQIAGRSEASGSYSNTAEFIEKVLAPFGQRFSTADPFRPVDIGGVFADADTVIVLWDGRGTTIDETTYENSYAWFMRMNDGKVIDGTAFYDSIAFDELWQKVRPARTDMQPPG